MLVIADDSLARAGLATLLTGQPGCVVVGQVASGDDMSSALETYRPDAVVWDLGWDPAPALERLGGLRDWPLVALLPSNAHAAKAWAAGARGLLLREADAASLMAALSSVARGLKIGRAHV